MGIALHHLTTFVAVAESGSLPEAARRLRYTQPTVSHHVQALERAVGARLFTEDRELSLTCDGERVLDLAERILTLAAELPQRDAVAAAGAPSGEVVGLVAGPRVRVPAQRA